MKGKVAHRVIPVMMALLVCLLTVQISGADQGDHKWEKITFQTPLAFSAPQKLGLDAVVMVHPPESAPGKGQMEIILVAVPKDLQESLGKKDDEIRNYVKGTFLASTLPATRSTARSFLGKKVAGEGQAVSIPKKGELEFYLVPLADGDQVAVAFKWDAAFPKDKADSVITKVAESFKEMQGK
jgi:hypothetical protein